MHALSTSVTEQRNNSIAVTWPVRIHDSHFQGISYAHNLLPSLCFVMFIATSEALNSHITFKKHSYYIKQILYYIPWLQVLANVILL